MRSPSSRVVVRLIIGLGGMFIGVALVVWFANSGRTMDLPATGTFITELFKAVAWPVGILVIVLIFREQIANKIRDMASAEIQGQRFEFEQKASMAKNLNEASRSVEKLGNETGTAAGEGGDLGARMPAHAQECLVQANELVDKQPKESMIASFEPVKTMILDAAKNKGIVVEPTSPVHKVLRYLSDNVDDEAVKAVESLEQARRDAISIEGPISTDAARSYVHSAQDLAQTLHHQLDSSPSGNVQREKAPS